MGEDAERQTAWALDDIRRELADVKDRLDGLADHLETILPRPAPKPDRTATGRRFVSRQASRGEKLVCSFCGKSQKQVRKLVAGPGVYICDECSDLVREILEEEIEAEVGEHVSAAEAAALMGLTRQRIYQLASEDPTFPQPVSRSPAKWRRTDVESWKTTKA